MTKQPELNAAQAIGLNTSRKSLMRLLLGAAVGAVIVFAALSIASALGLAVKQGDGLAAVIVGVAYAVIGLLVLLGAIMPGVGAKLLNVEDEAELRHERRKLLGSAAAMILSGAALFALQMASHDGSQGLERTAALLLVAAAVLTMIALSHGIRKSQDEYARRIGADSAATSFYATLFVFGGWAVLAHLGFTKMFTPLTFLAGALGLLLLSVFVVAGRRGMLSLTR